MLPRLDPGRQRRWHSRPAPGRRSPLPAHPDLRPWCDARGSLQTFEEGTCSHSHAAQLRRLGSHRGGARRIRRARAGGLGRHHRRRRRRRRARRCRQRQRARGRRRRRDRVHATTPTARGNYSLYISTSSPPAFPLTVTYEYDDPCLPSGRAGADARRRPPRPTASVLPTIALPARELCAASSSSASAARRCAPTAYVDTAGGRVISGAGGIAYLRLRDPVRRDRRRRCSTTAPRSAALRRRLERLRTSQITAPAVGGSGALTAAYAVDGAPVLAHARHARRDRRRSSAPPATSVRRRRRGRDRHLGQHERHRPAVPAQGRDARAARPRRQERPARRGRRSTTRSSPSSTSRRSPTPTAARSRTLADQHILDRGGTDYNVAFGEGLRGAHAARRSTTRRARST